MDVFLHSKVKSPYYDLTIGGVKAKEEFVRFDKHYGDELRRDETALASLKLRSQKYQEHDEMAYSTPSVGAPTG